MKRTKITNPFLMPARAVAVKTVKTKQIKPKVKNSEPLTEIISTFTSVLNKPTVFITLLISFILVLSHADDLSSGPLKDLLDAYPDNPFIKFLVKAGVRTLGLIIFIPVLIDVPKNFRLWLIVSVCLWVYFTESRTTYSYALEALCMHAFFKVRTTQARIIIVAIAAVVMLTSGVAFVKKPASTASAEPERKGRQTSASEYQLYEKETQISKLLEEQRSRDAEIARLKRKESQVSELLEERRSKDAEILKLRNEKDSEIAKLREKESEISKLKNEKDYQMRLVATRDQQLLQYQNSKPTGSQPRSG